MSLQIAKFATAPAAKAANATVSTRAMPTAADRPVRRASDAPAATAADQPKKFDEFVVVLDNQAIDPINKAFTMPTGMERRQFVYDTLTQNMRKTQEPLWNVIEGLQEAGHVAPGFGKGFQPLWIQNAIIVNGDDTARQTLSSAAGVAHAVPSATHRVRKPGELDAAGAAGKPPEQDPQYNIRRVGADKAWKDGLTGKGVTFASIDTGVQVDHPALLTNFRGYDASTGSYDITGNWYDATGESPGAMVDDHGHGTHTTGTDGGTDGRTNKIGVAPDMKWFAARGLGENGGTDGMLLKSFQYVAAPTVPTPGVAPGFRRDLSLGADVIGNSWGSNDGLSNAYTAALRNMAAMGIVNVFAAGNDGKGGDPSSLGSPASSPYTISVAATDRDDKVAQFSSRGPNPMSGTPTGEPSPFVAAPGVDVRSAVPGDGYERGWNGTSMAQPAASGVALLAQQAAMEETGHMLDIVGMKEVLKRGARDVGAKGPDHDTGYGIVNGANLRRIVREVARDLKLPDSVPARGKGAQQSSVT